MIDKRRKSFNFLCYTLFRVERKSYNKIRRYVVKIFSCKFDFFDSGLRVVQPADDFQIVVKKALYSYAYSIYAALLVKSEFFWGYTLGIALDGTLFQAFQVKRIVQTIKEKSCMFFFKQTRSSTADVNGVDFCVGKRTTCKAYFMI